MQVLLEVRVAKEAMSIDDFSSMTEGLGCSAIAEEEKPSGEGVHIAWIDAGADIERIMIQVEIWMASFAVSSQHYALQVLNDDWATAWKKAWAPLEIGNSLRVRPSFCEKVDDHRIDLVLDPGMAFGTGTHPTTQLCLQYIEEICSGGAISNMLDMGAGSGILAIGGKKLGIADVTALDCDPIAVEACQKNARMNQVGIQSGLADTPPSDVFDLVVANILANPLIEMSQPLSICVGRHLVLAGLLVDQQDSVVHAYENAGLELKSDKHHGDWSALYFVKKAAA